MLLGKSTSHSIRTSPKALKVRLGPAAQQAFPIVCKAHDDVTAGGSGNKVAISDSCHGDEAEPQGVLNTFHTGRCVASDVSHTQRQNHRPLQSCSLAARDVAPALLSQAFI